MKLPTLSNSPAPLQAQRISRTTRKKKLQLKHLEQERRNSYFTLQQPPSLQFLTEKPTVAEQAPLP